MAGLSREGTSMARRSRRSWKPEVARLESRDVPTVVSPLAFGAAGLKAQRAQQRALGAVLSNAPTPAAATANGPSDQASNSPFLDPTTLTPKGLRIATFKAINTGPYAVTTPVYNTQTRSLTYIGRLGSNQFLHGTLLMHVEIGTDGSAFGYAALRNRNVSATGSVLGLDLGDFAQNVTGTGQGVPTTFDALGRPVRIPWNVDTNFSGGVYAGAYGEGFLTITYTPNGHSKNSAGGATITFTGLAMPNNVSDITAYGLPKFN
jgi:hypothetical protein